MLNIVKDLSDFPEKTAVIAKLTELINTVKNGGQVDGVEFAISNAGGYAREPTAGLQQQFFEATGLTNADGTPLRLGFTDTVSPSELADRIAVVEQLGGNPRSPTFVSVTEPLILDPAAAALTAEPIAGNMQGAWLAGLVLVRAAVNAILGFFPTSADLSLAQLQPEILAQLNSDPSLVGVLFIYIALVDDYSAEDLTDTVAGPHPVTATFIRWEWQYGPSADDAYAWWAAPDKIDTSHSAETPPRHYEQYFWWFDRKATTRYAPRPRK